MNTNDLFVTLGDKEPINKSAIGDIYELVGMFPYFQSAHLLLLKGLNDNQDARFHKQMRHSALHVANREVLYYYLNPRAASKEPEIEKEEQPILLMDGQIETVKDAGEYVNQKFAIHEKDDLLELDIDLEKLHATDNVDKTELSKQQQSKLIDKFITANPRMEPVRDKNPRPVVDLAAPHLEETGGLVTETLAQIYINQEYYSKAIIIYEKLILKYPEKSSYFAAQIEKVKEYIKK
jgi:tetratricopeptide (TPR) repeat protein